MKPTMNKIALVTGASKGIGRAIATELMHNGYDVIGVSRSLTSDSVLEQLGQKSGVRYSPFAADITKDSDHSRLVEFIRDQYGRLDVLVNNAGIAPDVRMDVLNMTRESYDKVLDTNLNGPAFLTRSLYPLLEKSAASYLVFITSVSAVTASVNRAEYCISKAGLSMFAQVMAARLAQSACRVFEIRPGVINTEMIQKVRDKYETLAAEGGIPVRRLGEPEDIAKAVRALVSGDFDYAHGSVFEISGGMQIRSL